MLNKKYSILLSLICLFCIVAAVNMYQWLSPSSVTYPSAENGVMDASRWDFAAQGTIPLRGQWEFYPGQLLGPEDFRQAESGSPAVDRRLAQVPGSWKNNGPAIDKYGNGSGTYRLLVRVNQSALYSLRTKKVRLSSRIFINGIDLGGSGKPALSADDYVSSNVPFLGSVRADAGTVEIIVQAASFGYNMAGGLAQTPEFGLTEDVASHRDEARLADMALITMMIVFGLYYAGTFRHWRREPHFMYFSLFCLSIGLYFSIDNEILLTDIWPGLTFSWLQKLLFILPLLSYYAFLLYVYRYLQERDNLIFRAVRYCAYGYFVLVLLLPNRFYVELLVVVGVPLAAMAIGLMLYAVFHSRSRGTRGSHAGHYILVGIFFLLVSYIYALMHYTLGLDNPYDLIVSPLLLVLSQALLMSEQIQDNYRQSEQLNRQLLRYDRQKDEFLVKTSHELRTPLHGIINLSQALLDNRERPLPAEHRDNIRLLHLIGRRLAGLVNDILDLNRIRYGELAIRPRPVNLAVSAGIVFETLSIAPMNKDVRLVNKLPSALPLVIADENRLKQILHNLLENGLKYTDKGTVVLSAERRGDELAVSVTDTGRGIPSDRLADLFQPFVQLGEEDDVKDGLGLGLSITKQLVELQGGRLETESAVGRGSRFTFTLPIDAAAEETALTRAEERSIEPLPALMQGGQGAAFLVLIVDDEPPNRKVLIDEAGSMRYSYVAVGSGEEALAELRRGVKPDLVLLDLMMPGISGLEVCREIRTMHGLAELPVLMLTASGRSEDVTASFAAGANDILQKPFELTELRARMQSLIAMKSSSENALRREMDFLQAQIQPHFLYNSMNSILSLSYRDIDKLRETIHHLTTYLRAKFKFSFENGQVPFEQEMELVGAYLAIEQLRFGSRLQVEWDIDDGIDCMLPSLVIQPIVENAVRHGVVAQPFGGKVRISAHRIGVEVEVTVEDDGAGMDEEKLSALTEGSTGGVGIGNVNRRLQMLYGRRLDIASSPGRGTRVTLRLPCGGGGGTSTGTA